MARLRFLRTRGSNPAGRRPDGISRRGLLAGTGVAGVLATILSSPAARLLRGVARADDGATGSTTTLHEHDLDTLMAFSEVLLPSSVAAANRAGAGGREATGAASVVRGVLDEHTTDAQFRAAAAFLDECSAARFQRRFAELGLEERRAVVNPLFKPYASRTLVSNLYYAFTDEGRRISRMWQAVAQPIIVGFYASSLGWQVVHYSGRPGECSNLIDYQFPIS